MPTKTQCLPRAWCERRRLRALALQQQGWTGKVIAAALGVSQSAVSPWRDLKGQMPILPALRTCVPVQAWAA